MTMEQVLQTEIDDTIFKAIYGMNGLQKELTNMEGSKEIKWVFDMNLKSGPW